MFNLHKFFRSNIVFIVAYTPRMRHKYKFWCATLNPNVLQTRTLGFGKQVQGVNNLVNKLTWTKADTRSTHKTHPYYLRNSASQTSNNRTEQIAVAHANPKIRQDSNCSPVG